MKSGKSTLFISCDVRIPPLHEHLSGSNWCYITVVYFYIQI